MVYLSSDNINTYNSMSWSSLSLPSGISFQCGTQAEQARGFIEDRFLRSLESSRVRAHF